VVTLELPLPCCFALSIDEVGRGVSFAEALERAALPEDEVRSCLRVRDFFLGSLLSAIMKYERLLIVPEVGYGQMFVSST
jgi:tRNA pseudouridine-54 N-methylase